MATEGEQMGRRLRVLCPKRMLFPSSSPGLQWLIGSPHFLPEFTVISSFRCLHYLPDDPSSPDFAREADDIRTLLLRGFDVVGALVVDNGVSEENARMAVESSCRMRKSLFHNEWIIDLIGAVADLNTSDIQFFVFDTAKSEKLELMTTVVYEDTPEDYLWEKGCLLRCELAFKIPVYAPINKTSDVEELFSSLTDAAAAKFKDPSVAYLVEGRNVASEEASHSILLHGSELGFKGNLSDYKLLKTGDNDSNKKSLSCSMFFSKNRCISLSTGSQNADALHIAVLSNHSRSISKSGAPIAQYFPALDRPNLLIVNFKLDVLCYSSRDVPIDVAISKLVVPGLVDQISMMRKGIIPQLLTQHPQLCLYHFLPPGFIHPITAIYECRYGETEVAQGEIRKSLHLRLGLPLDRPLLRIANALTFGTKGITSSNSKRTGSSLLKDVHTEIPSSGVSGGFISLVDGSYEYYHYLLDGIDDNGWGCAYRSLQTIISWFRLQHYTSVKVPSHREIQQALVEIGDKEPSFVGSREWIGAIELSFVLDKLLGVSCKIINVRSGSELPEKCRELAMHFETQGTPIMIGGGVLAYTLLGVDYNEVTGDSAFLILDPHYTGSDDLKKVVNGGWCGWKKAVDAKGRNFFLRDKFYNFLLPQRPNMV